MKSLKKRRYLSLAPLFCVVFASLYSPAASLEEAEALFQQREFSGAGLEKAKQAAAMAEKLGDSNEVLFFTSKVQWFLGEAERNKEAYKVGIQAAEKVLSRFDIKVDEEFLRKEGVAGEIKQKFSEEELRTIAEAFYYRTSNEASRLLITVDLKKIPLVTGAMQLLIDIGQEQVMNFAALRILGRLKYAVPVGADKAGGTRLLERALKKSKHPDFGVSVEGNTNTYYAEALLGFTPDCANPKKNSDCSAQEKKKAEDEVKSMRVAAKIVLNRFVNCVQEADLEKLNPDRIPENKKYRKEVEVLAKKFKVSLPSQCEWSPGS